MTAAAPTRQMMPDRPRFLGLAITPITARRGVYAQGVAKGEMHKVYEQLTKEREQRIKAQAKVVELRKEVVDAKGKVTEMEDKVQELELSKQGLIKDLEHERVWRQEWNAVHDKVQDAVARLYTTDPPAVIEERSHQVMAMLQERIASESYVRSQLADLEECVGKIIGRNQRVPLL